MKHHRMLAPLLLGSIVAVSALLPVSSAFAACSDCHWLYVRCMSRATTPERVAQCEQGRQDCEETFCPDPSLARTMSPVARKPVLLADAAREAHAPKPARR